MANKLTYSLTTSAPSRPKGVLCVVVSLKGSATGRKPWTVHGLTNPNFDFWDKKNQRFKEGSVTAIANNPVLDAVCALCDELLTNAQITTPLQFVDALKKGVAPKDVETLGDFLNSLIDEMRNGTNKKLPSRNYQVYRNLLHKLEQEGALINRPIGEIDNKCFIQFHNFLFSLSADEGGNNYENLMKLFKQVHTKAFNREKNNNVLRFNYKDNAPTVETTEKRQPLTMEQYKRFAELDLSAIPQSGVNVEFYKELYHDFCLFLYETKCRPVDAIRAHSTNIVTVKGRKCFKYTPEKKKNTKGQKDVIVTAPLSDKALQIIAKYEGKSGKGYVFPFSMNEYDWDFKDAKSWNNWNNRKTRALEMVNKWLKKVQEVLKVGFTMTLYTFRHTTLTHACHAKGANVLQIALEAGTSVEMLQKHYVSNVI